ncbi:MAG TPA: hypothetical protein ENK30_04505, partial [Anaerolineae bacterium]|nr:hypothetical protein [Anaerolineae bacterium]
MTKRLFLLGVLSILLGVMVTGCQRQATIPMPATPTPRPTPTKFVVKTVIGEGRGIRGTLVIQGSCVRVNGEALAWKPQLDVEMMGDSLRVFRKWNGQVSIFHAGDEVEVMGSCIYKGEGPNAKCVTPSVEESLAQTECKSGPYFVV